MPEAAIGVDIGGTKIAAGVVAGDGRIAHRRRVDTPAADGDAVVAAAAECVQALRRDSGRHRLPVGVGAAGTVDLDGVVRYAPNIAWRDVALRALLERRLGGVVTVDNDANAAAWAEFVVGAGRPARQSLVVLTLGTGVGGGVVLDGRLLRGAQGMGAELGHVVIAEGGPPCGCGNRGDLESLASGTAIGRTARELRASGRLPPDSVLRRADRLDGQAVTAAAGDGDAGAEAVLREVGGWLGVGMASLVNALDPELIVVGGGAVAAGDRLLDPARAAMRRRVMGREHRTLPDVVPAELGSDAGVIGAALLALRAARGPA